MNDGSGAGEQAVVFRQDVYEDYVKCALQLCAIQPCRDARLLKKAGQYLLSEPDSRSAFTVFPFHQAVREGCEAPSTDCRKHLFAFIKATELLETLCVNLFLQPWRKEIKILKTFTGPFVYCLLPVLSTSTIQSVLASIGYLPHTDTPQNEFRLCEEANADRAMLVGFELLLAKVECYHLLELLENNQLEPQEWLEVLQRRAQPTKPMEDTEKKATIGQKEEEEKEELDKKKEPLCLDTRLAENPHPKPRRHHFIIVDQSIMEMQTTYPDLAIRGRPLLPDKPHKVHSSMSSNKAIHTAELLKRDKHSTKAAATIMFSRNDGSKADEVLGDDGRSISCNDRSSGGTIAPVEIIRSFSNTDGSRYDDELRGPQAISLHITLKAGAKAEQSHKPGELQPIAEPSARTQQQADPQNKRFAKPESSSLSSMDEEQELRKLEERMGQLCVQENKDKVKRKERRKKKRQSSTEGETEEKILRKQVMETGPALSTAI